MKKRINIGRFAMLAALLLLVMASAPYAKRYVEARSCRKHLAAISQAARVRANGHDGRLPTDFASMSSELVTPRLFICPGDTLHEPADNWAAFISAVNGTVSSPSEANSRVARLPAIYCRGRRLSFGAVHAEL